MKNTRMMAPAAIRMTRESCLKRFWKNDGMVMELPATSV